MIRRFELTGDLGIAPGETDTAPEIVEEVTVAMAENAGRNVRSSLLVWILLAQIF